MKPSFLLLPIAVLCVAGCNQENKNGQTQAPKRIEGDQGDRLQKPLLTEASQELRSLIAKSQEFADTPFPISFNVIRKLENNSYEIKNRSTGTTAILKTTETEFKTTGIANLLVTQSDSIKLPIQNGFERDFQVFIESDGDETSYWELRKQIKGHRTEFWALLFDSNVEPASSQKEFAKLMGVTNDEIAYVCKSPNGFHKGTLVEWKNEFESRIAFDLANTPDAKRNAQIEMFKQIETDLRAAEKQFDEIDAIRQENLANRSALGGVKPLTHKDMFIHDRGLTLMRNAIKQLIGSPSGHIDLGNGKKLYADYLFVGNHSGKTNGFGRSQRKKYYGRFNANREYKNSEEARMILKLAHGLVEERKKELQ